MYNEIEHGDHVGFQLDNALRMNIYDDIVVLDDGSTDGTWDVLNVYARFFNNIHIFRSDKNSILHNGENRRKTITEIIRKNNFSPDWISNRAADILYPLKYAQNIREIIEAQPINVAVVSAPFIHLWRSVGWYRVDDFWGGSAHNNFMIAFWRYNKNFNWNDAESLAGIHTGVNVPTDLGIGPYEAAGLIKPITHPPLFGLIHYGMTTQYKIEEKFRWCMKASEQAYKIGRSVGMPPPKLMPTVAHWSRYNGYRTFTEFQARLERVKPAWVDEDVSKLPKPKIESLYELIKEYRPDRAQEYKETFDIVFREQ
jgi:glycosyltransferase involved in cell wall biosynthesis